MADELKKAKAGEKLSEKGVANALDQAIDQLSSKQKSLARKREQLEVAGNELVTSVAQHAVAGVAGAIDGATEDKYTELKGVPVKLVVGLMTEGFGIYSTMSGSKASGIVTGVGRALVDVDLYRIGRSMGAKWKKDEKKPEAAPAPASPSEPATQGVRRINWNPPKLHLTEEAREDRAERRLAPVRALRG